MTRPTPTESTSDWVAISAAEQPEVSARPSASVASADATKAVVVPRTEPNVLKERWKRDTQGPASFGKMAGRRV